MMKHMLATCAAALLFAACSKDDGPAPPPPDDSSRHTSWRRARLLIADAQGGPAHVFDVEDDEISDTLTLGAVTRLESSDTGNIGLAYLASNEVALLSSGVAIIDHVDHIHIYKSAPKVLPKHLSAGVSLRIVPREGYLGLFRQEATAATRAVSSEESLLGFADAGSGEFAMGEVARHAGVVVPMRADSALATHPASVEVHSAAGTDESLGPCVFAGGIATARRHVTFACAEDFLRVSFAENTGAKTVSRIPYPQGLGTPPNELHAHYQRGVVIAKIDARKLLRIGEGGEAAAVSLFEGRDVDACAAILEPSRGERVLVLGSDGMLHDIDLDSGALRKSVKVVEPFACQASSPTPQLALAPERAYVTSPATGELIDVDLRALAIARRHGIPGAPGAIVTLGLDVRNMNVAPGGAHDGFK